VSPLSWFRPSTPVFLLALLGLPLLAALPTTPAHAGSAEEGEAIASRWCVSCHDIGKGEKPAASDAVPTFDSIASRKDFNRVHLEAWLGHPHPPMPNLNLTRNEIDSLVNYIESLRTPN
jgi:mono/diheme cytochrome c family protein